MNAILYVGEHPRVYNVRWHCHDHWELIYCTSGEGALHLENGPVISYRQGTVVAIPPGESHMNVSDSGFTNVHLIMAEPTFPYKSAFLVEDDAEGHMSIAFAQARFYYMSDIKRRDLVLAALGELISSYMIVYRDNRESSTPVEQLRTVIIQNFADPGFELDQAIRQMPFSYDYLRKLFQKEMGLTPLKYMTDLRMKKAKSMLTAMWTGEYSMTEVAESCGFGDALYFSRIFKKYYGCSPSKFVKGGEGAESL